MSVKYAKPIQLRKEIDGLYEKKLIDTETYKKLKGIVKDYGHAYSRYKGAKNTGDNSTRGESLIDIKRILSEYTKVKAQSSKQRIPKGIKNSLQENFANKKIDEEGLEYLENIYQNHTVYFR